MSSTDGVVYLTGLYLQRDRKQRGTAIFVLSKEYRVVVDGVTITVPAGFESDLNSVPRGFRWLVSVTDGIEGAIVHDYLYRIPNGHTRAWSDRVLRLMDKDNINWLQRNVKQLGVRAGGWWTWRQTR